MDYKTIINRASDKATVIIEGEVHSFPMVADTLIIEYPKMKCSNSKLFHSEDIENNK